MTSQAFIYIGLGFAAASLLAILLSQFLFRRAYKKAARDLRGQIPLNQNEVNAEHDRLRAEFAVNLNKLEYKVAAMQQSELKFRVDATRADEQKLQIQNNLNTYIKKSVRWEAAHDNEQNIVSILKNKLKLQGEKIQETHAAKAELEAEQKIYTDAKLNYQIADAKYLKLKNDQETAHRELEASASQLSRVTKERNLQAVELEEAQKNNLIYEAKISEISTQMLFLSQELFAKKISLDLSEKSIDRYKNKLLTQKLQMRDASLKDKAIYAVRSKLDGTANLDLEASAETEKPKAEPKLSSINTNNIVSPKLVHNADKTQPKAATGLRGRMNSMISGTDD
ncbi:MAG: hypothetical protein COB13_010135 [OCS116 cluster bacterium]|uniref:Uncharacterized protein n=1 Tax=OCS116 cluster bacterium TaxID=2030921 RepID=A0A2A4Z523_9PROT|nr:hypothetical protein [OCS116 cluster bacterium]